MRVPYLDTPKIGPVHSLVKLSVARFTDGNLARRGDVAAPAHGGMVVDGAERPSRLQGRRCQTAEEARQPHAHAAFVGIGHPRRIPDDAKRQRAGQSRPGRKWLVPQSHALNRDAWGNEVVRGAIHDWPLTTLTTSRCNLRTSNGPFGIG